MLPVLQKMALIAIFFISVLSKGIAQPIFSKTHGFSYSAFNLGIAGRIPGSDIYYTNDGSFPAKNHGTLYISPLAISTTSVIRAVEIVNGVAGKITTSTYIFPDDVLHQPNNPPGYPSMWGPYTGISGRAIADYEMDPELMADPAFADSVRAALLSIPTVSIVTDKNFLFSSKQDPDSGGIYIYTGPPLTNTTNGIGYGWERPASFEIFDPRDSISLQADCGLRIEGGHSRRPEKNPKHSFRLVFRSSYGPSKLAYPLFGKDADSALNTIIIRANFGNTWVHWSYTEREMAQYLRDRWSKDTHMAMGHTGSHGFYCHLYLNGIYWGLYNPSERLDADFAESYFAGNAADMDIIKDYGEVADGNILAWNSMMLTANAGLTSDLAYQKFIGNGPDGVPDAGSPAMVDPVSLADYMLLNFYGGNWDWDHHNWTAMRNRVNPGHGFRFYCWDEEHMVETVDANILGENNINCPSRIFQQMIKNQTFKRLFADRVQKFCFNNGVLTPSSAAVRWVARAREIDKSVNAESARWGDYRRDVHPWQTGPYDIYTKEAYWIPEMNFLLGTYFPQRTDAFIATLRSAGLFPLIDAPQFLVDGNPVKESKIAGGEHLTMKAPGSVIYFTIDGSDPVDWQNNELPSKNAKVYSSGIELVNSVDVKARSLRGSIWSAANEQFFILPEDYKNLKITEINYNPENNGSTDGRELEFIELKNTGPSVLNLGGTTIGGGIQYKFEPEATIKPQEFIVVASNPASFEKKYGFLPYDLYKGQLGNEGERVVIRTPDADTIIDISYSNGQGWPLKADGHGYSIVPQEYDPKGDQSLAENWRASHMKGGSPGFNDVLFAESKVSEILIVYTNYPNPFSELTTISYKLHSDADVTISIFNSTGMLVARFDEGRQPSGIYGIEWNGIDKNNSSAPSGVYFYRISAVNWKLTSILTNKMILIR